MWRQLRYSFDITVLSCVVGSDWIGTVSSLLVSITNTMELSMITTSMLHTTDYWIASLFFASFSQGAQSRVIDFYVGRGVVTKIASRTMVLVALSVSFSGTLFMFNV
jgi:hypothetical protein